VNIGVLYAISVFNRSLLSKFHSTFPFWSCTGYAHGHLIDCRYILEETAAYKQAIRETDSDVQPLTYWFAKKERFPHLFDLAIRYLSVPTNSLDAERSVSQ